MKKVEVERVGWVEVRNLIGYDARPLAIATCEDFIHRSTALWLGKYEGMDACVVGLMGTTVFVDEPYLWMLHSKLCEQHPLLLIRWSKKVMGEILDLYPSVRGQCKITSAESIRWLEWLGARFGDRTGALISFRIERDG